MPQHDTRTALKRNAYALIWSTRWQQFIRVSSKHGEFIPDWRQR